MDNTKTLSYVTSPLSEYIGSHIFQILGYDVHETLLGVCFDGKRNKVVCACKDFINDDKNELITKDNRSFRELLEILSQQTKIECLENVGVLSELAKGYKDEYITTHLLAEYNRITFVRLMALLKKEGIENNIQKMLLGL